MDGLSILGEVIEILVGGITQIGTAIGTSLSTLVSSIFLTTTGTGADATTTISTFGIFVLIFAACALGFSLTRWALNFLTSLGRRNR